MIIYNILEIKIFLEIIDIKIASAIKREAKGL